VEESRTRGEVIKQLNSTFIALIPKANHPNKFFDFRPIALCNLCYKIITKIIERRIHPILSRALSEEQLGFLKGRQILDAIGTAQECLHSIKDKKIAGYYLEAGSQEGLRLYRLGLLASYSPPLWFWGGHYKLGNGLYIIMLSLLF
jgi:hypothetical protein